MGKAYRHSLLAMGIIVLLVLCLYSFLSVKRHIRLYDEREVYTSRETGGLFWHVIESEEEKDRFIKKYHVNLPGNDFSKCYLLVSDGRKIRDLTYRLISKFLSEDHELVGEADFDPRPYLHSMFVYRIKQISLLQDLT